MLNQYFVTGTDTGVGKTLACAMLVRKLNATYWKPVQSGLADEISDVNRIIELTGLSEDRIIKSNYALQASLSPDQAAKRENITIDFDSIVLPKISTPLIVEGAGGVFVPLNEKYCMLDLMQKFQLPVIIVARGLLGTINHTLLTIEALRQRNLTIHGIIFSGELNPDNQTTIEKWGKVQTLFHIPLMDNINDTSFA